MDGAQRAQGRKSKKYIIHLYIRNIPPGCHTKQPGGKILVMRNFVECYANFDYVESKQYWLVLAEKKVPYSHLKIIEEKAAQWRKTEKQPIPPEYIRDMENRVGVR